MQPHIRIGDTIYEPFDGNRFDCVLTNPPFGTKGANAAPERDDLPEPQDLAAEAITELEAVVDDLREIIALVERQEAVEA